MGKATLTQERLGKINGIFDFQMLGHVQPKARQRCQPFWLCLDKGVKAGVAGGIGQQVFIDIRGNHAIHEPVQRAAKVRDCQRPAAHGRHPFQRAAGQP